MNEEEFVRAFVARVGGRSADQLNAPFETDAEVVRVGPLVLAVTTDAIAEEVRLLRDLETIGWLAVVASLSDLAAVGARPVGVLLGIVAPLRDPRLLDDLARGVRACLGVHGVSLLGGDTNDGETLVVTTTGLGVVERDPPLRRSGARPGDAVFVVGEVGLGNLVALHRLTGAGPDAEACYRPRLPPGWLQVCGHASACIDTSDGLLAGARGLVLASACGLALDLDAVPFAAPVREAASTLGLPLLAFAAGTVGDYGLLFTVPAVRVDAFVAACRSTGVDARHVGRAVEGSAVEIGGLVLDADAIAALAAERDPGALLVRLGSLRGPRGPGGS